MKTFLFWDNENDELELLGEDGEFYFYNEDSVAIEQGCPEKQCRSWGVLCKIREVTPLNSSDRFDVFDPILNKWIQFNECDFRTFKEICLHAVVREDAIY